MHIHNSEETQACVQVKNTFRPWNLTLWNWFWQGEGTEWERENAADQMMALSANHNLHLTQVEPQQLVSPIFFFSFFTLQVDICFWPFMLTFANAEILNRWSWRNILIKGNYQGSPLVSDATWGYRGSPFQVGGGVAGGEWCWRSLGGALGGSGGV